MQGTPFPQVIHAPCSMKRGISVQEAHRLVMAQAAPVETERVPLMQLLGRTLRADVRALNDVPPFDNSAMDGFAVRWTDCQSLPAMLRVVETITAGEVPLASVAQNTAAAIMTGAPMPAGADTVVPVEWTECVRPERVWIKRLATRGAYVRRAGQDAAAGDTVQAGGAVITPPVLGMIAAAGLREAVVSRLPSVAVIVTGNEIHSGSGPLPKGKIHDINGLTLAAQITAAGGRPCGPFYARDKRASIRAAVEAALEGSDVLLISGGVSVGEHDLVKAALDDMGFQMHFWRVRQRPGGPLAFGLLRGRKVFGLPGNPVSSSVCFEQYARPLLAAMLGRSQVHRPRISAVLSRSTPKKKGLHYFTRGVFSHAASGQVSVRDTGAQASNLYSSIVQATCIIHLDAEMERAPAGTQVEVEPLTWHLG